LTPALLLLLTTWQASSPSLPHAAAERPAIERAAVEPSAGGPVVALPADGELESAGAVIGEVRIVVGDVFDPSDPRERLPGAGLANRLHPATRRKVIAEQLLFRSGDRFDPRLLAESERLLRGNRNLRDVQVRPIAFDGQRVTVEVSARDVWTLNLGFSFGHAGGASSSSFELEDTNVLGSGKLVRLERAQDVDRTTTRFALADPALLGSRFRLDLGYSDASDGGGWQAKVERPFYALDARWSLALAAAAERRIDSLYRLGHVAGRFGHDAARFELRGGLSPGLVDGRVTRWTGGFTYQRDRFTSVPGSLVTLPPDRTLAYPWVAWDWQRDAYEETRNVDQIGRVEDLQLGPRLHGRLGIASPLFGADRSALLFDATAGSTLARRGGGLLRLETSASGRLEERGLAHTLLHGAAQAYWRDFGEQELYVSLSGDLARALDPEQQLTLGGDDGLRGYPLRYQAGDARLLLTAEQRFFTDWYPLRLARVGAAAFYDLGRVWGSDRAGGTASGWLQDLGVGLRLAPTRTGRAGVIHLDLAFPLGGTTDLQRAQWSVRSRSTF
jgi:hypothetical protein